MPGFPFTGLRARVMLLVLLAVLPALALTGYTASEQRRLAAAGAQAGALALARHAAEEHHQVIEATRGMLMTLARLPEVRRGDAAACTALLADLLPRYPAYLNLSVASPDGDLFCTALPQPGPLNIADRVHFKQAIATRDFAGGEYMIGRGALAGKGLLAFAYPIIDEAMAVRGVVNAVLDMDALSRLLPRAYLPEGSLFFLVDDRAIVLAAQPDPERWVGKALPAAPIAQAIRELRGEGTLEAPGAGGTPRFWAFAPLLRRPEAGHLYVAIGVRRETAFAGIDQAFLRNTAALGVVGLLALLAAWVGGDLFVLRRVRALARATKRLAAGDLRVRTGPPYGTGEIGDLSRAFDAMADALQRLLGEHQRAEAALLAAQEELEQRVRERTADLARANEALRAEVAERKRAEERYRSLVESTPDGIAVHRGGTLVYLNAAAAHIIGASSPEQILGRPVLDFVHPDYVETVRQRVRRALEEGTPAPLVEEKLIRVDGTPIDVEIVAIPTTFEGQPAVQVVVRDITARKRAEEGLRSSYERLAAQSEIDRAILTARSPQEIARAALVRIRRLVPCQRAAVMLLDAGRREARIISVDEDRPLGLREGLSVPFDELWSPILAPHGPPWHFADLAALEQRSPTMERSLATGVRSLMLAPLAVDQQLVGVLTLAATQPAAFWPEHVEIASELATSLAVVLHGARLQASLAAEEKLLRTLVDNLPEGVILLDSAHRIVLANAAARAYLPLLTSAGVGDTLAGEDGWSVEELCALPPHGGWREVVVPGPQPRVFELAAQCVAGAADAQSCVLVVREVTQERTVQAQLERQERLATVGQLAAGIGHDFNNLLAGIMLYAEVLEVRYDLPADAREKLGIIIRQCHRGAGLARQILDFSRQSAVQKQPLDLVPFSKELFKLFQRTLPEDVRVTFTSERPEHWVQADPTQLQQVVTNLAINARDAMPEGGGLALRLSHLALAEGMPPPCAGMSPGAWVHLEVSDTGTGIAPEVLPRIFEPFFTTKEPGRGTGLGLAQVYGLVQQHGGHIDVASRVGAGTSFSIYLPALQRLSAGERDELESGVGGGETILLVEDDPVVRDALSALLEELGCQVLAAANGDDALRLHERHRHDIALVVTDLVMPGVNGMALLRALRERSPQLKAVVMTGYAPEEGDDELRAKGIVGWIEKPMDRAQLMHVIRQALG